MTVEFKVIKHTEQVIPEKENLLKLLVLLSLVLSSFFLTQTAIDAYFSDHHSQLQTLLKWGFVIIVAILNAVLIMGLGILAHEAAHRVLFKNVFWNDFCGGIFAAMDLVPFYSFRDFHFTHHRFTHYPDVDPEAAVNNHPVWFTLTLGPLIGLYIHYKTDVMFLLSGSWEQRSQGLKDLGFVIFVAFFYFYLVPLLGISVSYTVIPTILVTPFIFMVRNVSEHHGIPPQYKKNNNRADNLNIDSWIVLTNPVMTWLWSNINYHQVHHRYPYLSYRYLPEIFEATKLQQPYMVVNGYIASIINALQQPYYGNRE